MRQSCDVGGEWWVVSEPGKALAQTPRTVAASAPKLRLCRYANQEQGIPISKLSSSVRDLLAKAQFELGNQNGNTD